MTELSLVLTLLDYVDVPDLLPTSSATDHSDFRLPTLSDTNIFHTNFFRLSKSVKEALTKSSFDWVVGNPPWSALDPARLIEQDEPVWEWISRPKNRKLRPCGDNEAAQAFAWRVCDFLSRTGSEALLLPALTLFKNLCRTFRARFLVTQKVTGVANL